jgi:TolB-like protein/DNA-binding winged helix-turn-helix (wHTH) protein/tetratricopeptide (TPR) repeat protein
MGVPRVVRFGTFEFDFESGELRRDGRKATLQGQPAQILSHLLITPGQIVTREELRRTVWADDTFVDFDAALNVAINKVRQALGDSASAPRFIETIPRRGYRFLADVHPVEVRDPALTASAPAPRPRHQLPRWRWVAGLSLGIAVLAVWSAARVDVGHMPPRSIAVLPFRPLVDETRDEGLEVGLAEAVIVRLGQLKQLRVPSINAVQRYARVETDPLVAGRDLGVDAVLDGRLQRRNGNVRLSARLLDVDKGTTLWAQQWDFPWTDIFTVQDGMAAEVTRALALRLVPEEQASLRKHPTNVAAYEAYLRARHLLLRRTITDSRRAAELLEEAVRLDPDSAAAHASLAFAYISVPLLEGPSTPFVELGRRATRRALDLDPTMAEAHAVLGRILVHFDWDAAGSDRAGQRALELDPTNPFVLHCRSLMLADQGRFEEALTLADRALTLDPTSVLANRDKAMMLFRARRYDECVGQCQRTLELDRYNSWAYDFMGRAYEQLGRPREAIEAYLAPLGFAERNRDMVATLRAAADRGGLEEFWKVRLRHLLEEPDVRTAAVAAAYVKIGDHDRAFEWLEKLLVERGAWIVGLKVQPQWDPLRSDPRFHDLLRRANLAPLTAPPPSHQP